MVSEEESAPPWSCQEEGYSRGLAFSRKSDSLFSPPPSPRIFSPMSRLRFLPLIALLCFVRLAAADHPVLPLGSALPDFKLPGVDGRTYSPENFSKAEVLAVVFTSNHCPTAQLYEERVKKLVSDFTPRNVAFVAINPNHPAAVRLDEMAWTDLDDTYEAMKIRARDRAFNYPYLDDGEKQETAQKFGAVATPHIFIFDRNRRLRFEGRIDDSERPALVKEQTARLAIEALLAGKEPPVTKTKVFGCSLKWREKSDDNKRWLDKVAKEPVTLETANNAKLKELIANKDSGKVRILAFWSPANQPSVAQFDEVINTNLRFRNRDCEVITVAVEKPAEEQNLRGFLQHHHASTQNFITATADAKEVAQAINPSWNGVLPHVVIVNTDGKVLYEQSGATDFLALRRALLPALDAAAPWPASGKG